MLKDKTKIGAIALAVAIGAGLLAVNSVKAEDNATNPITSLVQKIATKFGLKQADVQAVFDEDRSARMQEREAAFEEKLTTAVTNGELTQAQKDLIVAKRAELEKAREAERESNSTLSVTERKTKMEAERTALEEWAKANNIDMKYLMGGMGHGGMGGRGMGGHMGE